MNQNNAKYVSELEEKNMKYLKTIHYMLEETKILRNQALQNKDLKDKIIQLEKILSEKQRQIKECKGKLQQKETINKSDIMNLLKTAQSQEHQNKLFQKMKEIENKNVEIRELQNQIFLLKDENDVLKQQIREYKKANKFLQQQQMLRQSLQRAFIQQKDLLISKNYNYNRNALKNSFSVNQQWNIPHKTNLTQDGLYLKIPQQILTQENMKFVHELFLNNQWPNLEHLYFDSKPQLQKNYLDEKLWKTLVSNHGIIGRKFEQLKILRLYNHKILHIQLKDFKQFPCLQLLDFRTNSITQKDKQASQKCIEVLKQYAKENPKIKIRVTINGQGQDWFENKIIESKETCD